MFLLIDDTILFHLIEDRCCNEMGCVVLFLHGKNAFSNYASLKDCLLNLSKLDPMAVDLDLVIPAAQTFDITARNVFYKVATAIQALTTTDLALGGSRSSCFWSVVVARR
jgi:hypothetical protein